MVAGVTQQVGSRVFVGGGELAFDDLSTLVVGDILIDRIASPPLAFPQPS